MPTKPMRDDHVVPSGAFDPLAAMRLMLLIRRFEEQCLELSRDGEIAGSVHVCLGQEAVPAGAAQVLTADDRVVATYRGHGWALACGVPPEEVLAEICQRATGTNGGRAGSPYLSAPEHGFVGENSIVGAGAPIGAGLALAAIAQQRSGVVLVSLGDGAMNQGATHEALAFSAARDLPVVLVCENNGWSEMTPTTSMFRVADIAERAAGYGIPGRVVDGNDPEAVHAALHRAVVDARAGGGAVGALQPRHRALPPQGGHRGGGRCRPGRPAASGACDRRVDGRRARRARRRGTARRRRSDAGRPRRVGARTRA
jgi:2-oxoisovalerate dehydrogenase E1 component